MKVSKTGYKKNSKDKNQPSLLIPSNRITMKGVEFPVLGIDNYGNQQMMYPGVDYLFPGDYVYEKPMKNWMNKYQDGGQPSPMSWTDYLKYINVDDPELKSINPRDYLLWDEDAHTLLKDLDSEKAKNAKALGVNFYERSGRYTPHESDLLKDAYNARKSDIIDTYNLLYFNADKQDYSGSPGNVKKWEGGKDIFYPGKFAIENEGDESLTAQEILERTKKNYNLPIQDYASQRIKNRPNYADTKIPYTRVYPRTLLMDYNNPSADFNAGIEYMNDPRYTDVSENFYSDPPSARPMSFFPAPSYNYANVPKRYDEKGNEVISKYDVPNIKPNTYYDFPGSNTEMIYNEKLRLNDITKENIRNIKTIDPSGNIGDIDYNTVAAKRYINDPWFFYGKERHDGDPYCINCDKLAGSEHSQDNLFDYFKFKPQSPSSKMWWMKTFGLKPPRPIFLSQPNATRTGQVQIGWDIWDPKQQQWKAQNFSTDEINRRREEVKVPKDGGRDVEFKDSVIHDLAPYSLPPDIKPGTVVDTNNKPVIKEKQSGPKVVPSPTFKSGGWLDSYDTMTPAWSRNPEGNWVVKAQKGRQVKYTTDPVKIQNYNDSLTVYNAFKNDRSILDSFNTFKEVEDFVFDRSKKHPEISQALVRLKNRPEGYESIGKSYTKEFPVKGGSAAMVVEEFAKPKQPYKKYDPKEMLVKTPKLQIEPTQLIIPQSDRTLQPYNNTRQVLRSVQKEDRFNQNLYPTRVVPAPEFRHGGWLDKYQGDEGSSQVERRDPNQPFFPSATEAGTYESQYSLPEVSVTPNWTEAELERNRLRDKYIADDKKVWRHWYDKLGYDKDNVTKRANQFAYNKLAKQYLKGDKDKLTDEQKKFIGKSEYANRLQPSIGARFVEGVTNPGFNLETLGNLAAPLEYPTNLVRGAIKGEFADALKGQTPSPYFVSSDLAGTSPNEAAIASGLVDVGVDTGIGAFDVATPLFKGARSARKAAKNLTTQAPSKGPGPLMLFGDLADKGSDTSKGLNLEDFLTQDQIDKGYSIVRDGDSSRYFLKKNNRYAGEIELFSPVADTKGDKWSSINIEIDPSHRGKGLSTPLYKVALNEARNKGYSGIKSIDEMLQSPEQSKAIRKYFPGRYSTDENLVRKTNEIIDESNKGSLEIGDTDLYPNASQVYLIDAPKGLSEYSAGKNYPQTSWDIKPTQNPYKYYDDFAEKHRDILQNLRTPEGRKRVQALLDANPHLTSDGKYATVDDLINQFETTGFTTRKPYYRKFNEYERGSWMENQLKQAIERGDVHPDIISKIKAVEKAKARKLSSTDLQNTLDDLPEYVEDFAGLVLDKEGKPMMFDVEPKSGFNWYWSGYDKPSVISIGKDWSPYDVPHILEHEWQHVFQKGKPLIGTDDELKKLDILSDSDLQKKYELAVGPKQNILQRVLGIPPNIGKPDLGYSAANMKDRIESKNYFLEGSAGQESAPMASEIRENLLQRGIIKNRYDEITPKMLKDHYNLYRNTDAYRRYPIRVYDIMKDKNENFNLLSNVLNKLPATVPAIGAGYLGYEGMQEKKYGGWLNKYQDGSQVPQSWKDKYDWTPNVEEEYQMFKNDPNAPENLRFTDDMKDYNTRGMWDSLDRPSNWQQALDLFKQQQGYEWTPEDDGYYHAWSQHPGTGEWLKPKHHSTGWMNYMGYAFDPNTTAVVNPEGFFGNETLQAYPRKKNGGIKSSGEGYYDYINGYSGIFANGGAKGWLDNYK